MLHSSHQFLKMCLKECKRFVVLDTRAWHQPTTTHALNCMFCYLSKIKGPLLSDSYLKWEREKNLYRRCSEFIKVKTTHNMHHFKMQQMRIVKYTYIFFRLLILSTIWQHSTKLCSGMKFFLRKLFVVKLVNMLIIFINMQLRIIY